MPTKKPWGGISAYSLEDAEEVYERVVQRCGPEPVDILGRCWIWKGYGDSTPILRLRHDGKSYNVRRALWVYWTRRQVPHLYYLTPGCSSPQCIRRDHLELRSFREARREASASAARKLRKSTTKIVQRVRPTPSQIAKGVCEDCGVIGCRNPTECADRLSRRLIEAQKEEVHGNEKDERGDRQQAAVSRRRSGDDELQLR